MREVQGRLLLEPYVGCVDNDSEHIPYHAAAGPGWKRVDQLDKCPVFG
jgi:hypothetical protein